MPIYEFKCERCGVIIKKICSFSDPEPLCPCCGFQMRRCISSFSFKSSDIADREKRIFKLAQGYLKDGKIHDAHRFLKKASEYVKSENIKKAVDKLSSKLES